MPKLKKAAKDVKTVKKTAKTKAVKKPVKQNTMTDLEVARAELMEIENFFSHAPLDLKEQLEIFIDELKVRAKDLKKASAIAIKDEKDIIKQIKAAKKADALKSTATSRKAISKFEKELNDLTDMTEDLETELRHIDDEIATLTLSVKRFGGLAKVIAAYDKKWNKENPVKKSAKKTASIKKDAKKTAKVTKTAKTKAGKTTKKAVAAEKTSVKTSEKESGAKKTPKNKMGPVKAAKKESKPLKKTAVKAQKVMPKEKAKKLGRPAKEAVVTVHENTAAHVETGTPADHFSHDLP